MGNLLSDMEGNLLRQCAVAALEEPLSFAPSLCRTSETCRELLAMAEDIARRRCEATGRQRMSGSGPWRRALGHLLQEPRVIMKLSAPIEEVYYSRLYYSRQTSYEEVTDVVKVDPELTSIVQLPDGRIVSGSNYGTRVWDMATRSFTLPPTDQISAITLMIGLTDGRIVSSYNMTHEEWEGFKRVEGEHEEEHEEAPAGIVTGMSGLPWQLCVWDLEFGSCMHLLTGHTVTCLLGLADGRIVTGDSDGSIRVWDLATDSCIQHHDVSGDGNGVDCMVQVADGRVVSYGQDTSFRVWELTTGSCTLQPTTHRPVITCVIALADGRIASWGVDRSLQVFDLAGLGSDDWLSFTKELIPRGSTRGSRLLPRDPRDLAWQPIRCMLGMSDGRLLTSGVPWATDKCTQLRLWDLETGTYTQHLTCHTGPVLCMVQLADGRIVTGSGSEDMVMLVWA